jgi:hypothetical protein
VPEAKKARQINISTSSPPKTIEAETVN